MSTKKFLAIIKEAKFRRASQEKIKNQLLSQDEIILLCIEVCEQYAASLGNDYEALEGQLIQTLLDMDANLKIGDHPFSKKEIALVDSFVLTKLGEGHGEATLYLGGKKDHEDILSFFEDISFNSIFTAYFAKSNLLKIFNFYEPFFQNPHSFYLSNGQLISFKQDLLQHYKKCISQINESDELIPNEFELLKPDSQGRIYLRVFSDSLLRRLFLPYSVKVSLQLIQLHKSNNPAILIACYPFITSKNHNIKVGGESLKVEINYLNPTN